MERGREGTGRRKGRGGERGGNGRGGKARGALGVDLPYLLGGGGGRRHCSRIATSSTLEPHYIRSSDKLLFSVQRMALALLMKVLALALLQSGRPKY